MTVHENEILMFTLGLGVYLSGFAFRDSLGRIPDWPLLRTAYYLLLASWAATLLEGFCLASPLNLLEHTGYAASAILVALWCWRTSVGPSGSRGA